MCRLDVCAYHSLIVFVSVYAGFPNLRSSPLNPERSNGTITITIKGSVFSRTLGLNSPDLRSCVED